MNKKKKEEEKKEILCKRRRRSERKTATQIRTSVFLFDIAAQIIYPGISAAENEHEFAVRPEIIP